MIKKGWGEALRGKTEKERHSPDINFFVPAYMAEIHGFSRDI